MNGKPQRFLSRAAARAVLGLGGACLPVWANPQGPAVLAGSATLAASGSTLTVTTSSTAVLNWQSFNIGPGERTIFNQPSSTSIVFNQISDPNPSKIYGSLQANGIVVLANSSGFWFGPNSVIKAASFIATTSSSAPEIGAGGAWNLSFSPPAASIINYGQVQTAKGGSLFLVAEQIENHGVMTAPDGTLGLYAGKQVLVSDRPDGRGLSATVSLPAGSVNNYGKLVADAGQIALQAQVVNQAGLVQANSAANHNGVIELLAGDELTLGPNSQTLAQGDPTTPGNGGQITLKSGGAYIDSPTARVSAAGGRLGGDGGQIEISANDFRGIQAQVDAAAGPGGRAGALSLDPSTITIATGGADGLGSGTIPVSKPGTLTIDPASFTGFTQITLEAKTLISVNSPLVLGDEPGGASFTLRSGGNIQFGTLGSLAAGAGWSISLIAGATFASPTSVQNGVGSITLTSSGFISAVDGAINLTAGKDVTVAQGYIHTTGGGAITVNASGSINSGAAAAGYDFGLTTGNGYAVDPNLGGISTAAGGNVTLNAGKDVTSLLPTLTTQASSGTDAGSGAFGPEPGNVSVTAGGNVYGHYVVANGTGSITASANAGTSSKQLALSLVEGSWTVNATSITLQEVRNPSGVFNLGTGASDPNRHLFDYGAGDSVSLVGSSSVVLLGAALPRDPGNPVPIFYPGTLSISAGAGGVGLGNSLTMMPAPLGELTITTTLPAGVTTGGDLYSVTAGKSYTLGMSDSGAAQYSGRSGQFGQNDHAATPVHENDPSPVVIDLAGNLTSINLVMPKATVVSVGGNLSDSSLATQNLHPSDVTSITVAGNIANRNIYTSYPLPAGVAAPDFSVLAFSDPPVSAALSYDPSAGPHGTIYCRGALTQSQLQGLLTLQVDEHTVTGRLVLDQNGNPIPQPYQILPASVLNEIYAGSQTSGTSSAPGFTVGGPGKLLVSAANIDLGSTPGIAALGAGYNPALAPQSPVGASVVVQTPGDLSMFSSAIVSLAGGPLTVSAGGSITVGSTGVPASANTFQARGIYSTGGGAVTVEAAGNIDINGSRIATYDGGALTVTSTGGTVNAGTGGLSIQQVTEYVVNGGVVKAQNDIIPGSGILATTFTYGDATVGNITVDAPRGDIIARSGGIIQAPFNGTPGSAASISLTAGTAPTATDPGFVGKIDASGSVVAGGNVSVSATGAILGFFLASGNLGITTPQAVSVTALAGGTASVSAGGSVSGTIIGVGGVSASGSAISANLVSQNVTTSGGAATGQVGLGSGSVAGAAGAAAAATTSTTTEKKVAAVTDTDEDQKRRTKPILTRTVGRVTVVLPSKSN